MSWSLSRAAREAGVSKSTISRAIKAGRLSAARGDDGAYLVEPAEVFRVYPRGGAQPRTQPVHDAVRNRHEDASATPSAEAEILKVKVVMLEAMLAREQETVADLRLRLDAATHKVLALAQPPQPVAGPVHDAVRTPTQPPVRRSWWNRLRGR